MKTYTFEIEVAIDEDNIEKKYPNFRFNYINNEKGLREFAKSLATPFYANQTMKEYGFKISKPRQIKGDK